MLNAYTDLEVRVREFGRKVAAKEEGATMVEYALLVALIAIALIAVIVVLRGGISSVFSRAATTLNQA